MDQTCHSVIPEEKTFLRSEDGNEMIGGPVRSWKNTDVVDLDGDKIRDYHL